MQGLEPRTARAADPRRGRRRVRAPRRAALTAPRADGSPTLDLQPSFGGVDLDDSERISMHTIDREAVHAKLLAAGFEDAFTALALFYYFAR